MKIAPFVLLTRRSASSPWNDKTPVRNELFGAERLQQHAQGLATAQKITLRPLRVLSLPKRLDENAAVLLTAYRASAAELESGNSVEPAAEWLLDNYHVVEEQVRQIRRDLPPGFYRQLPKLASGPFEGYPRVLGIAWAFVAHTDSNFDPNVMASFIAAYQTVQPLTIGELWAIAITLRIVLVENLRRLADELGTARKARIEADELANRLLKSVEESPAPDIKALTRDYGVLSEMFAAQLAKRLRNLDPDKTPALDWLEQHLALQGSSVDTVVQKALQRQGASNVSVRNVITSMRLISDIDWADWFESVSLVDEKLRKGSAFADMDFATRDRYRKSIEQLAHGSGVSEIDVAQAVLDAAGADATIDTPAKERERRADPGYYLIAGGRAALEATLAYAPDWRLRVSRFTIRCGITGYLGAILGASALFTGLVVWMWSESDISQGELWFFLALGFIPLTEFVTAVVNRLVTLSVGAAVLPGLDLTRGVPEQFRTLVAVPTMLSSKADLLADIENLEVHYLSGSGGDLTFALLTDGVDADTSTIPIDAKILAAGVAAITTLNQKYGPGPAGSRFLLLHRTRRYNPGEGKWMGWERKRGKLHELNRLLRGAVDTTYEPVAGLSQQMPAGVRYVLTLDSDTRLPRDAAQRLVGKMAHPLNWPIVEAAAHDPALKRVVHGHAILQPRVTPSLPMRREGSAYQRLYSSPAGLDPYAAAVSDVYQDLFGEGSYTGKGIYDIDAFELALAGRVPDNTMLSHDLFEGVFARAGLASDIEVVEAFPSRYDVASKRLHRWTRGDWQLLPWLFVRHDGGYAVPAVGRGKMFDNLRRSTRAAMTFLALGAAWLLPLSSAFLATLLILLYMLIPALMPTFFSVFSRRGGILLRNRLLVFGNDLALACEQVLLSLILLPDTAWKMSDAITRTLWRTFVTHRHMLEWTTAAQSAGSVRLDLAGFYRWMGPSLVIVLVMSLGVLVLEPMSWPLVLTFTLLWLAAPACAWWVSRPRSLAPQLVLQATTTASLRRTARRTWRYFEVFVTAEDCWLPPDNFQETPKPELARRTSPTNMGMYLLSAVAARDLGWTGTARTVGRLEATLGTMLKLQRYNGHFFNWYATDDMHVLDPAYVSSVDSGNLAGHLITLANACEEWVGNVTAPYARVGLVDNLGLARDALSKLPGAGGARLQQLEAALEELDLQLSGSLPLPSLLPMLGRLCDKAVRTAQAFVPAVADDDSVDLLYWIMALQLAVREHESDMEAASDTAALDSRLKAIAKTARAMAVEMDFSFLLEPDRKLLSIGYSLADNSLDASCYDLLASECRLASFFAIAKGDVPSKHWLRLGRTATPVGRGSALISWSGSMFEYLMPSLIMRAPIGSLLEQTSRLVVQRQQDYGVLLGIPWGISESAFNARDIEFTYQYFNFGVPGLGLKRGLSQDKVVAPYATGLAAMVDPENARKNYKRLANEGALGRYGFHEALDYTRSRLSEDQTVAIVRSFMAHHQGMTVVALANALLDGQMRKRFHREPMVRACELLLQERVPRDVAVAHPRAEEVKASVAPTDVGAVITRRFDRLPAGPPPVHMLSNGRYTVMLTTAGGGFSRWGDVAITRWRPDPTRDHWGSFIFMRDMQRGTVWSSAPNPDMIGTVRMQIDFTEDKADFMHRDGSLATSTQIVVSGENDGEVRRVSLVNSGRRPRDVELTSYSELALAPPAADNAHPAFSKMFVVTEYLTEFGALVATRRPRTPDEPSVWAAHFAVVEGDIIAPIQYETDRARFLDRCDYGVAPNKIISGQALSDTVGTVLDPVFSLRYCVRVKPGRAVRVAFWTLVAPTREALLNLIDTHHDRSAFDRAKTLAWTQAQVQLRHLGIQAEEAASFQQLAAPLLYPDSRFRVASDLIVHGAGSQSGLWPHGISGDLPIVLVRIDDAEDIALIRQLLRAHEYWHMKGLSVDLVIINERASSYVQDLQNGIETAVRSSQARPRIGDAPAKGVVYALRADLITMSARELIQSIARIVLVARHGLVAEQLGRIAESSSRTGAEAKAMAARLAAAMSDTRLARQHFAASSSPDTVGSAKVARRPTLEYDNGLGGFGLDGKEYVITLDAARTTPVPWINVIANRSFGFQVSAEGSGYTWANNSQNNQLTPWSNDPVQDPPGEVLYLCDKNNGDLWSPTAAPIRHDTPYIVRHGHGYSVFEHEHEQIASTLLQYVPWNDPVKISRLTLTNKSEQRRQLSVTAYVEWVLGTSRADTAPFLITHMDAETGAMFAQNPWSLNNSGRIAFVDLLGLQSAWTADRREFLGDNGSTAAPLALISADKLSGRCGAALDPCAALQCEVWLDGGETVELVVLLGQADSEDEARKWVTRYRGADLDAVLDDVKANWEKILGTIQVKTPDRAMDLMLNGWLQYQTIACRMWARSAFYQASGAYGFRDQLQDSMALMFSMPDAARAQLLRAASRQFPEGDVQHWWLPKTGQGVRTRISDDKVWLAYAAANYVLRSGDETVLEEPLAFLEGPALLDGEHDAFYQPTLSTETASLFEHCARGLDLCLDLTGEHGLPLMGTGDWNDGMSRVGELGRGESVWLGWLLLRTLALFEPMARERDPVRAERWRQHAGDLAKAIEAHAWEGQWYRRATFDDGTWLGTTDSEACQIDSIAQSWAVLSEAAVPDRAAKAMASFDRMLVRHNDRLALLFTPPFDAPSRDPGYIKGYPPGLRENGGQYTHAAMWAVLAYARQGDGDKAADLFALLNPINHARTPEALERYQVEPYVVAADVYSVAPHVGRGGWTWYTGSAAWMYRAGIEGILGLQREGRAVALSPCIPLAWPGFEARLHLDDTHYHIVVEHRSGLGQGVTHAHSDDLVLECSQGRVLLPLDGGRHTVIVSI
ncbi:GH36-type glycosyl hydrolase domain-containing protein [Pusillimonas sp. ANT_WB101]|uniref:GH36-type glycosyl hydrolase domain-containing protein n=1 Tax=Pusillimonas sp. ANT_WB101 TaxID=2597356 RepID=UPI0011EBC52E|nr:glucoamylase family protein [Pusillimonas sp. ANT_WB101]KAA0890020.1 glycosyl transferase [Pusillimonas sp. ANT_WB101]